MKKLFKIGLIFSLLISFNSLIAHDLKGAVESDDRSSKYIVRDNERNPLETLSFFGRIGHGYSRTITRWRMVYRNLS